MVRAAHPEVIIQQLTDLRAGSSAANARMRREGTRNLVDAARAAGVRQFIAQSISWVSAPGDGPADEHVPLDLEAPEPRRTTIEGVDALERAVAEMERGLVLRYGTLYGLGTWYAPDGSIAQQVRQGQLTADEGITSFVHVEDAARAALLALDWPPGIVTIVDDEPAPRYGLAAGLCGDPWGSCTAGDRRTTASGARGDESESASALELAAAVSQLARGISPGHAGMEEAKTRGAFHLGAEPAEMRVVQGQGEGHPFVEARSSESAG